MLLAHRNDYSTLYDLDRLLDYLSDRIDLEFLFTDFYQELHDRESEAFHVWFYDLTAGVKI